VSRRRRVRARAPEPLDRERALARFRKLVGRSIVLEFAFGPLIDAKTPEQLANTVGQMVETKRRPS